MSCCTSQKTSFTLSKIKKIFLIGTPNVGKTTLFNCLTGSKEETANYGGTTVQTRYCVSKNFEGHHFYVYDLAGMYASGASKGEENIAWKSVEKAMGEEEAVFVQVINAGQWRQSLHLTLDLQKKGIHPILFFNTKKSDENLGSDFYKAVAKEFSLPVFFGDIQEKDFFGNFWKKFFVAEEKLQKFLGSQKSDLPKTFLSSAEQEQYIEKFFGKFSPQKNIQNPEISGKNNWKKFLDKVFLHSFFGVLVFLALMFVMFELTFTVGAIPMDWIDSGTTWLQAGIKSTFGETLFSQFLADGLVAGVGGTVIFLPNILILFFFLSFLKESGYLARTSFLFNTVFQKLGLSGRASIPLLMGFGCNVPSIMAIKTFETRKEQVLVAFMTLFMSCGARLPVYALLIAVFIPDGFQGATLFFIYILGILVSFMTGKILSIAYKRKERARMIAYEMPTLQFPSLTNAFREAYEKGKDFLINVGKFIVPVSVVLWLMFTFPLHQVEEQGIEASYGASIGKTIQPVFEPMNFDWKISTALLSGVAAKEVMVTTFGQLYHAQDEEESLQENIKNSGNFSLPIALALIIFVLLYTPCLAVVGTIRKELGNFWAGISLVYPFVIAWIFSFVTYTLATFFLI